MISLLGKMFEKMLAFFAYCILFIGGFFGYSVAPNVISQLSINITEPMLVGAIGALIGIIIAFVVDVIIFGFVAQILDIRRNIEKLSNPIDKD